jgi:hypothetical protein
LGFSGLFQLFLVCIPSVKIAALIIHRGYFSIILMVVIVLGFYCQLVKISPHIFSLLFCDLTHHLVNPRPSLCDGKTNQNQILKYIMPALAGLFSRHFFK